MLFVAALIGLFPKELPKKKKERISSTIPKMLQNDDVFVEEELALKRKGSIANVLNNTEFNGSMAELPPTFKGNFIILRSTSNLKNKKLFYDFRFSFCTFKIAEK